jgi:hypothetical protein
VPFNPRVQGASGPGASPPYASSDRSGGADSTSKGARCPDRLAQDVICGLAASVSLGTKNVGGREPRRKIDAWLYHRGEQRCVAPGDSGSGAESSLQHIVSS